MGTLRGLMVIPLLPVEDLGWALTGQCPPGMASSWTRIEWRCSSFLPAANTTSQSYPILFSLHMDGPVSETSIHVL